MTLDTNIAEFLQFELQISFGVCPMGIPRKTVRLVGEIFSDDIYRQNMKRKKNKTIYLQEMNQGKDDNDSCEYPQKQECLVIGKTNMDAQLLPTIDKQVLIVCILILYS